MLDLEKIKQHYSQFTTEKLTKIANSPDSLSPEIKNLLKEELNKRGVEIVIKEKTRVKNKNIDAFNAIIFGVLLISLSFIKPVLVNFQFHIIVTINIIVNILIRVFVVFWLIAICKKYVYESKIWIVLGVLFGGWTLFIFSIFLLANREEKKTDKLPLF